jgi:uncharacterized protein (DUF1330 family)
MPAYVVITREKTLDPAKLEEYKQVAPAVFEQHPVMMLASHGRKEVVEGPAIEEILILEFTGYDEALAWVRRGCKAATTGSSSPKGYRWFSV